MEKIDISIPSIKDWKKFIAQASLTEIIEIWERIPEDDAIQYFLHLNTNLQSELLLQISTNTQENLISNLANKNIEDLLNEIPPDDLVDLFQKISPEIRKSVWEHLSEETRQVTNFLLRFDYDDAAGIMTPNYVKVRANITVAKTISFIRKNIEEVETIYYIYIVDAINRLQGVVSLRDLFRKKDNILLSEFMITNVYSVQEHTDQEITAKLLQEHDLLAIPVLDKFHRLLGIVTVDDAMEVIAQEHDEDVLKMGAITASSNTHSKSYLENKIINLFRSRLPWLAILLIASTLTTNVINLFSSVISAMPYLILFIPVITSTGGNTATQSATLMIQGIARNEISFKNVFSIVLKEMLVALLLGGSLGILMLLRSLYLPPTIQIMDALIISLSLVFVVLFSAIIGILAPLTISRIGSDPAVIATPLIATLIDLIGLTIYFSLARLLLIF